MRHKVRVSPGKRSSALSAPRRVGAMAASSQWQVRPTERSRRSAGVSPGKHLDAPRLRKAMRKRSTSSGSLPRRSPCNLSTVNVFCATGIEASRGEGFREVFLRGNTWMPGDGLQRCTRDPIRWDRLRRRSDLDRSTMNVAFTATATQALKGNGLQEVFPRGNTSSPRRGSVRLPVKQLRRRQGTGGVRRHRRGIVKAC